MILHCNIVVILLNYYNVIILQYNNVVQILQWDIPQCSVIAISSKYCSVIYHNAILQQYRPDIAVWYIALKYYDIV